MPIDVPRVSFAPDPIVNRRVLRLHPGVPLELALPCLEDASRLGYSKLEVEGGEPLAYPAVQALLRHARAVGLRTTLTTDGTLATLERWTPIAPLLDAVVVLADAGRDSPDLAALRDTGTAFELAFPIACGGRELLHEMIDRAALAGAGGVRLDLRGDPAELIALVNEAARRGEARGLAVHSRALCAEPLRLFRDRLVPAMPVADLVDVAPVLVVESDSTVMPLASAVNAGFALGRLADVALSRLARYWIAAGEGERLAEACERTWRELAADCPAAVLWYDEVAARTHAPLEPRDDIDRPLAGLDLSYGPLR